ncbi:MAG: hypothetical protein WA632_10495, partial [Gallionella sp.]
FMQDMQNSGNAIEVEAFGSHAANCDNTVNMRSLPNSKMAKKMRLPKSSDDSGSTVRSNGDTGPAFERRQQPQLIYSKPSRGVAKGSILAALLAVVALSPSSPDAAKIAPVQSSYETDVHASRVMAAATPVKHELRLVRAETIKLVRAETDTR